jgi:hypothetical protein
VLLRLAYLGLANTFALLGPLPRSNRDKDIEILALRQQIGVLQRQLGDTRERFRPTDRALLTALLHRCHARSCEGSVCWPCTARKVVAPGQAPGGSRRDHGVAVAIAPTYQLTRTLLRMRVHRGLHRSTATALDVQR